MNKMNKKGFTLIEMLVVIAIIAVLVSIIVPVVSNSTAKAAAATNAANLRSAAASISIEYLSNSDKITVGDGGVLSGYTTEEPTPKTNGNVPGGDFSAVLSNGAIECFFGGNSVETYATIAETGVVGN